MVVGRCVLHPACEGSWHETDTVLCLWPSSLDFVWGCALLTPSLGFAPWARLWRSKTVPDGFVLTPSLGFALRPAYGGPKLRSTGFTYPRFCPCGGLATEFGAGGPNVLS